MARLRQFQILLATASLFMLLLPANAQPPYYGRNYIEPAPFYGQPYYPPGRQSLRGHSRQNINGENNWFADNRMKHWNRTMTNMISDMLGDGAGDFEFDMKIKFKAKGKGKGKSKARSRANTRADGRYRGRVQNGTQWYTRNSSQGRNGYNNTYPYYGGRWPGTAVIPTSRYPYPAPYYTYQSYPPVIESTRQDRSKKW